MNVNDLSLVDGFMCPHCLNALKVVMLDVDPLGNLESDDEFDFEPSYCPACGDRIEL